MDPLLLKVNQPDTLSFSANQFNYLCSFPGIWHYHPEYELTLIIKGSGTRFVGDHIDQFDEGDLVFLGKNLAHTWRTGVQEENRAPGPSEAMVIHFSEDFLGESFFDLPEMLPVSKLFLKSARGLRVTGDTRMRIAKEMKEILNLQGAARLLKLLSLLTSLAESPELIALATDGYNEYSADKDSDRLNKVYAHIMNNFRKPVRLTDLAEMANMSPTAFSRYFRQRTRKPFSRFLIEKKVGYACKLLMGERYSILQICYECGFQNVSSFNKQFKKITGITPRQYQLTYKPFSNQSVLRGREDESLPIYKEM